VRSISVILLIFANQSFGQTDKASAFEVASIKRSNPDHPRPPTPFAPDRLALSGPTLKELVQLAYHVHDYEVSGGPSWVSSYKWDVEAKTETQTSVQQKFEMLGRLLEERFQLRIHRETKPVSAYALVVAKNGPKLQELSPDELKKAGGNRVTGGQVTANAATMSFLTGLLTRELGAPVLDQTELKGNYSFKLEWNSSIRVTPSPDAPPAASFPSGPSIFTAIQQLGLRLESSRAPIELVVIDRAELPTEN
jgi:uncharacterized protein (TIGR03435 family)